MKLAPHECAQTTQKTAEFHQLKFINKVVDDRVTTQRQIPQSKWREDEAVKMSQIRFRDKEVDSRCTAENRCHRCSSRA